MVIEFGGFVPKTKFLAILMDFDLAVWYSIAIMCMHVE